MKSVRKNPYVDTNREGYLFNPQYANEWAIGRDRYYSIDRDKVVLWVHATEFEGIGDWFGKTLDEISKYKRFYVGGGANADLFGKHYVFVKYKPTKIFSGEDYFDEDSPLAGRDSEHFLDCLVRNFNFDELDADVIEQYSYLPGYSTLDFSKLNEEELKELLRESLKTNAFYFFEKTYVQKCLLDFGFTAYFEKEHQESHYSWEEVNLAILEPDFKNVEIVGILSPTKVINRVNYYKCPRCKDEVKLKEILDSTFEMGEITCEECKDAVECDVCHERTKKSELAKIEEDFWGNIVSVICNVCEEDRKCESCEGYFDDDELITFKFEGDIWDSRYCQDCYASEVEAED